MPITQAQLGFLQNVNRNGPVVYQGLGNCWTKRGKSKYGPHRRAYKLFVGQIPKGLHVCHKCDNPKCVRPSHLFLGTRKDNMQDCSKKGRHKSVRKPESVPKGDTHFARARPELLARGDRHGSKTKPEMVPRGDRNGSRTHPERLVRGENHLNHIHPERVQGENNGRAQLTETQVREIKHRYRPYVNNHKPSNSQELANEFGVSKNIISLIGKGKTWRHIC